MTARVQTGLAACALMAAAGIAQGQSFREDFDNVAALPAAGWTLLNASSPLGVMGWYQGNLSDFPPQASPGFIETNYMCGAAVATLNNWLLSPVRTLRNGDTVQFWTRTIFNPAFYPDRLQVRLSQAGASSYIGNFGAPTSVGDFGMLLLDINPQYTAVGFPAAWTQYAVVLSGLPAQGVAGRFAFRYFVEGGGPGGVNSAYVGVDSVDYTSGGVPSGACCLIDGSCSLQTASGCSNLGGAYRGDGVTCEFAFCPLPFTGACCRPDGGCTIVSAIVCTALFGVYGGDDTTCGAMICLPSGYVETGDAGGLPQNAATVGGVGTGPLSMIHGRIDVGDVDLFKFRICDTREFSASTLNGTLDTQLFLFSASGTGIVMDDDGPNGELGSILTGPIGFPAGEFFLGISLFNRDPGDAAGQPLWNNVNPSGEPYPQWPADGPGALNPVASWAGSPAAIGNYTITLSGSCFITPDCYVNCDQSTLAPVLNANDFQCFLNRFASLEAYANCDSSSNPPILNANDFLCFLNTYAAGCS